MMTQLAFTFGDLFSGTVLYVLIACVAAAAALLFRKKIMRWIK